MLQLLILFYIVAMNIVASDVADVVALDSAAFDFVLHCCYDCRRV